MAHLLRHEWDAHRGEVTQSRPLRWEGRSISPAPPHPSLWYFHPPRLLPLDNSQHRWLPASVQTASGSLPQGLKMGGGFQECHLHRGCSASPPGALRGRALGGVEGGPTRLPAARTSTACTAGADRNLLPESEGEAVCRAEQSALGAALALGSRQAREQSWPGCSCQGRRGPSEAAKAG